MSRPVYIYEPQGLPYDEAWSLFKQMAFPLQQLPNPSLEAIGKEIVDKCCGVPLAIKAIGGMLCFKNSESEWLLVRDNELSTINVYENGILPILKLSYDHFHPHYKQCFAYCSLFPKGFKIPVDKLIQLWKAHGCIMLRDLNECSQDVGMGYFMDLYLSAFFEDVEYDEFGNIEYCKMHGLMHDLAVSVAGKKFSASLSESIGTENNAKHWSFHGCSNYLSLCASSLSKAKATRTILALDSDDLLYSSPERKELEAIFCSFKRLRALDLSRMQITALPDSICKLKHLRYLDLSHNDDITCNMILPNSITKLQNLEVLKLAECRRLLKLPSKISKLVNLTDLDNYNCKGLTHMPRGIGKLLRLEKLPEFVIAKDHSISKHAGGLDELHSLNKLRGELHIKNLGYLKNVGSDFAKARLNMKEKLQKLKLNWGVNEDENDNGEDNEEMGMEALRPHPNLKQLTVLYYRRVKPPSWLPSIAGLVSLSILFCRGIQRLPPLNQLPHLKMLNISGLTKLESIDVENGGGYSLFFSCLTDLILAVCPSLKGFERLSLLPTEEIPYFPCLSRLEISGCPNLKHLPLSPQLKKLRSDQDGMKFLRERANSAPYFALHQLEDLCISNMGDFIEAQLPPSLKSLSFWRCSLRIDCSGKEDENTQWKSLKFLRSVEFNMMENMDALPEGLQYVTTLQRLLINNCPELKRMPDWMPKLEELQYLNIRCCPLLAERCKTNSADEWHQISHIPNISADGRPITRIWK